MGKKRRGSKKKSGATAASADAAAASAGAPDVTDQDILDEVAKVLKQPDPPAATVCTCACALTRVGWVDESIDCYEFETVM